MPHPPTLRPARRPRRAALVLAAAGAALSLTAGVAPASAATGTSSLTLQVVRPGAATDVYSVSVKAPGWRDAHCVEMDRHLRGSLWQSTLTVPTGALETRAFHHPGCDPGYEFLGSYGGVVAGVPGKWFVYATRPPQRVA